MPALHCEYCCDCAISLVGTYAAEYSCQNSSMHPSQNSCPPHSDEKIATRPSDQNTGPTGAIFNLEYATFIASVPRGLAQAQVDRRTSNLAKPPKWGRPVEPEILHFDEFFDSRHRLPACASDHVAWEHELLDGNARLLQFRYL